MRSSLILSSSILSLAIATPALAGDARSVTGTEVAAPADEGDPIIVEGRRSSYGAKAVTSATKTDTPIRDIPQAMTIITKAQIDDQGLRSIGDLLNFVPGASTGTGEGNRDQMTLRGNNSTADFFINGLRDDVQYFRDFYNVERIEVLKGPNAMIFGRGGGGGIVNRVIKQTNFNTARSVDMGTTTFGGVRTTGDIDQKLTDTIGLRVNGLYEKVESFRRQVELERYGIAPTIGFAVGPESRIDLSYEYFHDRRTTDRGVPSLAGKPLTGFDRTFFGDPDASYSKANVHLLSASVEHQLAEGLTLRNRTLFGDYDKFYQNVFSSSTVSPAGTVQLSAYNDTTRRENLFNQTDLIWKVATGGIDHTVLIGAEVGRQTSQQRRVNGFFQPTDSPTLVVPVGSPTIEADIIFRPVNTNSGRTPANHVRGKATIGAIYVQDQVKLTDWVEIVAGLRFDRFDLDVTNRNTGITFSRTDNLWSPRIGLVFKPTERLSLYTSYSRSYLPQSGDQFGGLDVTSEALKPERFDNIELGAKWEPIDGLLATAAIYQLDRSNTRAADPLNSALTVLTGKQRSRGLELGVERSITDRWQISAGYAWQEAEIRAKTTAAPAGRKVPLVPKHSFALWSRYDVTKSLGFGAGLTARSKSFASISNQVVLPGYARVDAAMFYKVLRGVEAQVNIENLLGANYFAAAHNDNNIAPGAPRSARVTLRFGL